LCHEIKARCKRKKQLSIQTIMPVGDVVTAVKFDIMTNAMAIHNGVAVGNVNDHRRHPVCVAKRVPMADAAGPTSLDTRIVQFW
jgi:hypothetical protein